CFAALVTDGRVRQTHYRRARALPVFSGSVSFKGTVKETLGHINQPLVFGDEIIYPGDVIKGDADGVVVVRRTEVEEAISLSAARDANEARLIELYKQGRTTIDLCNLHDVLRDKGITTDLDSVDPDQGLGAR
ncbi:MAG: 4-carboxy-4-hydroxy-2-oxoadipate aldolase/oxaloacetate decarboxylase, partial [Leifsonia sp.]